MIASTPGYTLPIPSVLREGEKARIAFPLTQALFPATHGNGDYIIDISTGSKKNATKNVVIKAASAALPSYINAITGTTPTALNAFKTDYMLDASLEGHGPPGNTTQYVIFQVEKSIKAFILYEPLRQRSAPHCKPVLRPGTHGRRLSKH